MDIPSAAEPVPPPREPPGAPEPEAKPEEEEEMQGETPGVPSSSRGEKRTEPQQKVFAKKRVMIKSSKRPATKGDDVLMPVEVADSDVLHTVRGLTSQRRDW